MERNTLLGQLIKRGSNGAEISHKAPIKSCKTEETSHPCNSLRDGPALNGFNL
uniref:Uncharacterized protein n=1 Tax=Arundo donax TaxID=35708 RepID=A0A0A9HXX2_ARUDO